MDNYNPTFIIISFSLLFKSHFLSIISNYAIIMFLIIFIVLWVKIIKTNCLIKNKNLFYSILINI